MEYGPLGRWIIAEIPILFYIDLSGSIYTQIEKSIVSHAFFSYDRCMSNNARVSEFLSFGEKFSDLTECLFRSQMGWLIHFFNRQLLVRGYDFVLRSMDMMPLDMSKEKRNGLGEGLCLKIQYLRFDVYFL